MAIPFARARGRRPNVDVTTTRNSIVDSAREVFACYGFGAATYEQIGRRVGLSRVAVSNHFPDKQDLYRAVVERADGRLGAMVGASASERDGASWLADLTALFIEVLGDVDHRPSVAFWLSSTVDADRDNQLPTIDRSVVEARLAAIVDEGISCGDLNTEIDVESLVALLAALFWGICFYSLTVGDDRNLNAKTENVRRLLSGTLLQINPRLPPP